MIKNSLKDLFFHIKKKRKIQFLLLLITTVLASFVEMLSVASVVPFVKVATSDNFVEEKFLIFRFISVSNKEEAIIITGLFFAFVIFINSLLSNTLH
jgi:hypothetical protein